MLFGDSDKDEIYLGGVSFVMTGESFSIAGRGVVHTAILTEDATSDELAGLTGRDLNGKTILGVEQFAVFSHPAGRSFGLLFKD